jgi:hypothetical protein
MDHASQRFVTAVTSTQWQSLAEVVARLDRADYWPPAVQDAADKDASALRALQTLRDSVATPLVGEELQESPLLFLEAWRETDACRIYKLAALCTDADRARAVAFTLREQHAALQVAQALRAGHEDEHGEEEPDDALERI